MRDVGLVGLPGTGKTTVYNALTRAGAPIGGAAGKASVSAVNVPDPRVDVLSDLEHSRKKVYAQLRFVDVAGLAAGTGGGLSASGLGALREVDVLALVLGAFGGADPAAQAADLTLELTVADLTSIAGGAQKAAKKARAGMKGSDLEASPPPSSRSWGRRPPPSPGRWRRRQPSWTRRTRPRSCPSTASSRAGWTRWSPRRGGCWT
jgi:ribosome-binding ATPase YchF (GTP1/OBG family)